MMQNYAHITHTMRWHHLAKGFRVAQTRSSCVWL